MTENLRIDHVIFGTADIQATAARLQEEHGLGSIVGGKHEGLGTGNRIVPLGSAYLELMGVVDEAQAAVHPFGRWFTSQIETGDRFLMWCIGTDDIGSVAERLSLDIEPWTRTTPDGTVLSWRLAGLEIAENDPEIPFFIQWEVPDAQHPSRAPAEHRVIPNGFATIALSGDDGRVRECLGGAELPVRFTAGPQGVVGVTIATNEGGIALL